MGSFDYQLMTFLQSAIKWWYLLLVLLGVVTAVPLLMFAAGARRLPLATVGFLQYLAPTMTFVLAVFVFGEPLGVARIITFALIWAGIVVYFVADRRGR